MERRIILAVVFSAIILFAYPYVLRYLGLPEPGGKQETTQKTEDAAPALPGTSAPDTTVDTQSIKKVKEVAPQKEELTVVETPLFKAVFSNIGGGIRTFELKNYRETLDKDSRLVNLAASIAQDRTFKTTLNIDGAPDVPVFSPSTSSLNLSAGSAAELVYSWSSPSGLTVVKKIKFNADTYLFSNTLTVINNTKGAVTGSMGLLLVSNSAGKDEGGFHLGPVISAKGKLLRHDSDDKVEKGASFDWLGLEDKYYLSAVIPTADTPLNWVTEVVEETSAKGSINAQIDLKSAQKAALSYDTFLGPKEYDRLQSLGRGLESAVEFGWFDFIARPTQVALNFLVKYLKNYGFAIIVLTVVLKVVFYPLTKKSLDSMKDMQKLQPQMNAIKEKYKDDKPRQQKEMTDLYKRQKINPIGGCLPMVLQIPVFLALYEVLYAAIELRHAPFILWITDLSAKDPYYVTPILMGASMFIQQKMTPTSMDPTQSKIMLFMPLIFTFMFLSFPSGLVIYWLLNNVLTIAQQYYMQHTPAKAKA